MNSLSQSQAPQRIYIAKQSLRRVNHEGILSKFSLSLRLVLFWVLVGFQHVIETARTRTRDLITKMTSALLKTFEQ